MNEARAHWNSVGGSNEVDFAFDGTTSGTGNFNDPCSPNKSISMLSMRSDLPSGTLARTNACNDEDLGHTTKFHIGFNPDYSWYTGTGTPASGVYDFRSIATHEFGHATGFYGHFSDSSILCIPGSDAEPRHTMCRVGYPGGAYWRSTEEHEIHTFLGAY